MAREVTFVSKYEGLSITQKEGKEKKARLWAIAPGLEIYLVGTAKGTAHDSLTNLACNLALGMHIPLISLRYNTRNKS